jgi:hypothetical protein
VQAANVASVHCSLRENLENISEQELGFVALSHFSSDAHQTQSFADVQLEQSERVEHIGF